MTTATSHRRLMRVATQVLLLAAAGVAPAWAQDAAPVPAPAEASAADTAAPEFSGGVTPAAQAVLDRMQATFKTMKRYAVTANITRDEVLNFGYKLQNTETARLWVDAPRNMRVEVAGDIKNRTYIYDGSQLTMFSPDDNVYATGAAPGTIGELVSTLLDNDVEMPLIDLLYTGFTGSLADDALAGRVIGESKVDGVATDHLAFRQANVDWQLWVEKGARAIPRKLVITTRYAVGDPQYQALLRWDANPAMNAKSFVFSPPAGVTKVPFNTELVATGAAE